VLYCAILVAIFFSTARDQLKFAHLALGPKRLDTPALNSLPARDLRLHAKTTHIRHIVRCSILKVGKKGEDVGGDQFESVVEDWSDSLITCFHAEHR